MKAPIGWKHALLHQVAEVRTGLSKSSNREGLTIKRPYLRVANVQDGYLDLTDVQEIDVPANQVERFTLKPGDLLLIEGNGNPQNLGRGCLWEGQVINCVHQNHVFAVRVFPESEIRPKFLAAQLQSDRGRNFLLSCAKGTTGLSTLNSEQLRRLPILLPPVQEQETITTLITAWNTAIEKTERLIAAKEKRYSSFIRTLIDDKCGSWEHIRADKIFKSVPEKGHGEAELLSVTQDRGVIPRTMLEGRVMSPEGGTESYKLIKVGDFAISLRSFQGGIEYSRYQGLISPAYTVLRPKVELHDEFYRHFFKSYLFIEKYLSIAVIGIRDGKQISIPDFMTVKIPLPPLDQQKQIASVLNTTRQEIDLLKKQAEAFRKQKRGLMQKLLTGQWRVRLG